MIKTFTILTTRLSTFPINVRHLKLRIGSEIISWHNELIHYWNYYTLLLHTININSNITAKGLFIYYVILFQAFLVPFPPSVAACQHLAYPPLPPLRRNKWIEIHPFVNFTLICNK